MVLAKLLNDQGIIVICSFISPKESIRWQVKEIIGENKFQLVFMNADLEYCRKNDQYGLYKLANEGKLSHLAGVDEEYDIPTNTDIIFDVYKGVESLEKLVNNMRNI